MPSILVRIFAILTMVVAYTCQYNKSQYNKKENPYLTDDGSLDLLSIDILAAFNTTVPTSLIRA